MFCVVFNFFNFLFSQESSSFYNRNIQILSILIWRIPFPNYIQKRLEVLLIEKNNTTCYFFQILMTPPKNTRRSLPAPTFTQACFFCEKPENLICASTKTIDAAVRKMATYLSDTKLISKLAEGKMISKYFEWYLNKEFGIFLSMIFSLYLEIFVKKSLV